MADPERKPFAGIPPSVRQSVIFVAAIAGLIYQNLNPPADAKIVGACLVMLGYPVFDSMGIVWKKLSGSDDPEKKADR